MRRDATARCATAVETVTTTEVESADSPDDARTEAYNKMMHERMKWGDLDPYQYHPQRGLYWNEIVPGVICGTQPRSRDDVTALHAAGVTHILSLQTDSDLEYWNVNLGELRHRCNELGVKHIRRMVRIDGR